MGQPTVQQIPIPSMHRKTTDFYLPASKATTQREMPDDHVMHVYEGAGLTAHRFREAGETLARLSEMTVAAMQGDPCAEDSWEDFEAVADEMYELIDELAYLQSLVANILVVYR